MRLPAQGFLPVLWTLFIISFITNLFVLILILRSTVLRRKPSIIYIVNGAIANFLFTVLVSISALLMFALRSDQSKWFHVCSIYDFYFSLNSFIISFTITAVALDKYFAIIKPFLYRQYSSIRNARFVVITTWLVAIIFCIPKILTLHSKRGSRLCSKNSKLSVPTSEFVSEIISLIIVFLIPSIFIFVIYGKLVHRLWFSSPETRGTDVALLRSRRKLTKLSITVTVLFVVCWVPHSVEAIWWCLRFKQTKVVEWFKLYASLFVFTYSAISPIIYALYNEATLQAAKRMFHCLSCKRCLNTRSIEVAPVLPGREGENKSIALTMRSANTKEP